jgi:hypothetical protein
MEQKTKINVIRPVQEQEMLLRFNNVNTNNKNTLKLATCCNEKQENAPRQNYRDFVAKNDTTPATNNRNTNDIG